MIYTEDGEIKITENTRCFLQHLLAFWCAFVRFSSGFGLRTETETTEVLIALQETVGKTNIHVA